MIDLAKDFKSIDKQIREVHRVVSLWLFGDLIYAVLPLIVLLTITTLLHQPIDHFLELKEWSFATIVLWGVIIRGFVRLKVQIQQTPTSYTLDAGIQGYIVLLIISVLVLALVVLTEKHALPEHILASLGVAQLLLFSLALLTLLITTLEEEKGSLWVPRWVGGGSRSFLLRRATRELLQGYRPIQYVLTALEKRSIPSNTVHPQDTTTQHAEDYAVRHILLLLDEIERSVGLIRQRLVRPAIPSKQLDEVVN